MIAANSLSIDELPEQLRRMAEPRPARQGTFQEAMRYRSALGFWYASMFSAARRGEPFDRRRPEPADFIKDSFPY